VDNHIGKGERNRNGADSAKAVKMGADNEADLAEAVILLRNHPQWAIWRPVGGERWAAIRPASSRPPAPELPTIWVHADTASGLARLMQACDEQVSGHYCCCEQPDAESNY
jgi:hypothetical protein